MVEWNTYIKPDYIKLLVKDLRKQQTKTESLLWNCLRNKQLGGYKFLRQKAIYAYTESEKNHKFFIADFYYHPIKLIIEIDGDIHNNDSRQEYDSMREFLLKQGGYIVIRFTNDEIYHDISAVLSSIHQTIISHQ